MKTLYSITNAQDIVSNHSPDHRYPNYRLHEVGYWGKIPSWMALNDDPRTLLDIGIAYGSLATWVNMNSDCQVYGVDFMKYISDELVTARGYNYQVANIETDVFEWSDKFDAIIMTEVLEHFNFQPLTTMKKVHSYLTPGGSLYLSTPDVESQRSTHMYRDWRHIPEVNPNTPIRDCHVYEYREDELRELLECAGFSIKHFDRTMNNTGHLHFNVECTK